MRGKGLRAELLDFRARDYPWGLAVQRAREADLVVLTSSPLDRWQCPNLEREHFLGLARQLEHPRLFITGAHGTLLPQRVLEACSAQAVVLGEPEATVADLAECKPLQDIPGLAFLEGGQLRITSARAPLDLSSLPMPALDLAPPAYYSYELLGERLALLETTRGCRHSCSFCLKAMYGAGLRGKHPQQVEQEVRYALHLDARRVYFIDLDFAAKRELAQEVCERLAAAGLDLAWCCQCRADSLDPDLLRLMRRAGCRLIHLGVESSSGRLLKGVHKGLPQDQAQRVVRAAENMGIATACFFCLACREKPPPTGGTRRPWPGGSAPPSVPFSGLPSIPELRLPAWPPTQTRLPLRHNPGHAMK